MNQINSITLELADGTTFDIMGDSISTAINIYIEKFEDICNYTAINTNNLTNYAICGETSQYGKVVNITTVEYQDGYIVTFNIAKLTNVEILKKELEENNQISEATITSLISET